MKPMDLNLKKKYSCIITSLINSYYTLTPKRRIINTTITITSSRWINPPPNLKENPPSHAMINNIIMISSNPILFTSHPDTPQTKHTNKLICLLMFTGEYPQQLNNSPSQNTIHYNCDQC